jgi:hypothetical protein
VPEPTRTRTFDSRPSSTSASLSPIDRNMNLYRQYFSHAHWREAVEVRIERDQHGRVMLHIQVNAYGQVEDGGRNAYTPIPLDATRIVDDPFEDDVVVVQVGSLGTRTQRSIISVSTFSTWTTTCREGTEFMHD